MPLRHPGSTRTDPPFPYTTLFRSHAVRVDAGARVAEGDMLAEDRRNDRLVIDAGIGHQHVERAEGVDGPAFETDAGIVLLQALVGAEIGAARRSEEHTSELQSLMRISYAVFCLQKKIMKIQK